MSDLAQVVAFGVMAVLLLALVSYMLYRRAVEMGHLPARVAVRLVVFWLGCLGALAVGVFFHALYPQGLFEVNFTPASGSPPVVLTGGGHAVSPLVTAVAGMALAALVAWLAIRPLQTPPPEGPEEGQQ